MRELTTHSLSLAEDQGYRALNDLAWAAAEYKESIADEDSKKEEDERWSYRVVGGHMVQLLILTYPTPNAVMRTTGDADAGIDKPTASAQGLHEALVRRGYQPIKGNHYEKDDNLHGNDGQLLLRQIDLLVPASGAGKKLQMVKLGNRGFDAVPGLAFANNSPALFLSVTAQLTNSEHLKFEVPIPDVEAALVLKAHARLSRTVHKDAADINSLLEIAFLHRDKLDNWLLDDSHSGRLGARKDAGIALYSMASEIDRGTLEIGPGQLAPARMAALIRRLVIAPDPI